MASRLSVRPRIELCDRPGRMCHSEPVSLRSWLTSFLRPATVGVGPGRVAGPPPSGNGASSFHLHWEVPPRPLVEASVTFELLEPPSVAKLYFWALQVSFIDRARRLGGAHVGLQHHPGYPESCAVNWGGYHEGGGELDGSVSDLPSALDNINTCTFRWFPERRYRFRVHPSPQRGWRATVTDLDTGVETVVRDLWVGGDRLADAMVWSEVFADCDHPSVAVRWTDLEVVTESGEAARIDTVRLNYQSHANGGCANTDTSIDGVGFVQRTNTTRTSPTGTRLTVPS